MFAVRPMFASGGVLVDPLPGGEVTDVRIDPVNSTASISVNSSGTIVGSGNASSFTHNWINGSFNPADYEVMLTVVSGSTPSGAAVGSWLSLSSNRTWSLNQTSFGIKSGTYTIQIRHISGSPSTSSAAGGYSMDAEVSL